MGAEGGGGLRLTKSRGRARVINFLCVCQWCQTVCLIVVWPVVEVGCKTVAWYVLVLPERVKLSSVWSSMKCENVSLWVILVDSMIIF